MGKKPKQINGFQFSGISAGIKGSGKSDLALIYSEVPSVVVGAFTQNRVQAAPVLVSKKNIKSGKCSAIIINSGNANACTGKQGLKDAERMVGEVSKALQIPKKSVLVCSTGVIGELMPMKKFSKALPKSVKALHSKNILKAARAILTTDKGIKIASASGKIGEKRFQLVGFAKGAGMIGPNMKPHATMLSFCMTDLSIDRRSASQIFTRVVEKTFNRVTVDGDTSTNDTAILLANGMAKNRPVRAGSSGARLFEKTLNQVMEALALAMVEDGEGATKCVRIEVQRARNHHEAEKIARTVANSPLVKTSFFGEDPNWGRVIAAAGRAGATLYPEKADIYYEGVCVLRRGRPVGRKADLHARRVMRKLRFVVKIDLHQGSGRAGLWTSDLGYSYVKINAEYHT